MSRSCLPGRTFTAARSRPADGIYKLWVRGGFAANNRHARILEGSAQACSCTTAQSSQNGNVMTRGGTIKHCPPASDLSDGASGQPPALFLHLPWRRQQCAGKSALTVTIPDRSISSRCLSSASSSSQPICISSIHSPHRRRLSSCRARARDGDMRGETGSLEGSASPRPRKEEETAAALRPDVARRTRRS